MSNEKKDNKFGFTDGTMVDVDGETLGKLDDDDAPEPTRAMERPVARLVDDSEEQVTRALEVPVASPDKTAMLQSVSSQNQPLAVLRIDQGPDIGREFPLKSQSIQVGRGLDCDVVLNDASISRKHFRLEKNGPTYRLVDQGSGNGTLVDGTKVTEEDLAHDARIKVGTTVLRFVLSNPGAAAAVARQRQGGHAAGPAKPRESTAAIPSAKEEPPMRVVSPRPSAPIDDNISPKEGGMGKWIALVAVLLVALGGIWYVGEAIMGWWNFAGLGTKTAPPSTTTITATSTAEPEKGDQEKSPTDEATKAADKGSDENVAADETNKNGTQPNTPTDEQQKPETPPSDSVKSPDGQPAQPVNDPQQMFEQAVKASEELKFDHALDLLKSIKAADPAFKNIDNAIAQVEQEQKHQKSYESVQKLVESEKFVEAIEVLRSIPNTSKVYPDAQTALTGVENAHLSTRIAIAHGVLRDGKLDEAQVIVDDILKSSPEHPEALQLNKDIAAKRQETSRRPPTDTVAVPKTGKDTLDTSGAVAAYKRGDFEDAKAALEAQLKRQLTGTDDAKARKMLKAIDSFKANYETGKAELRTSRAKAIGSLEAALNADRTMGGGYSRELKRQLAEAHSGRAAEAYDKQDYSSAAQYAKKALSYDSTFDNAKGVLTKCVTKGEALFDQAMNNHNSGNTLVAQSLFRQVIKILPSTHEKYGKAQDMLKN
ncbi:MAG: FHA domain-containing protein [Myxococcales bacterium]|nr:FHA domain-containing protein [Myxococcales bacterium]